MDYYKLADLLFPHIKKTTEEIEAQYPKRNLPEGAKVTRLGPSPTGFIHLGNLYGAFVDERLAHQSGGVFYLRIEDTDDKRYVEGAVETIIIPCVSLTSTLTKVQVLTVRAAIMAAIRRASVGRFTSALRRNWWQRVRHIRASSQKKKSQRSGQGRKLLKPIREFTVFTQRIEDSP